MKSKNYQVMVTSATAIVNAGLVAEVQAVDPKSERAIAGGLRTRQHTYLVTKVNGKSTNPATVFLRGDEFSLLEKC